MTGLDLKVLIVDDEPPARRKILRFLDADPDIGQVEEAANGKEAVAAIRRGNHDLVFLDVQMPGLDGFGVIHELQADVLPAIVFVTAHDEHAIKAFEVRALDYLLKPFDEDRFAAAIERAKEHIRVGRAAEISGVVQNLVSEIKSESPYVDRVMVKSAGRIFFVKVGEIAWIEAAGNYVKLHVGATEHLLRETMDSLLSKLDPRAFARVHRSHAVSLDYIREMYHWSHGDYMIVLKDGTELKLSRRYRDNLPAEFPG